MAIDLGVLAEKVALEMAVVVNLSHDVLVEKVKGFLVAQTTTDPLVAHVPKAKAFLAIQMVADLLVAKAALEMAIAKAVAALEVATVKAVSVAIAKAVAALEMVTEKAAVVFAALKTVTAMATVAAETEVNYVINYQK